MTAAIHYTGGLRIHHRGVLTLLAGWPVCCSGERCRKLAHSGRTTTDTVQVTCRVCLRQIARARANGVIGTAEHGEIRL